MKFDAAPSSVLQPSFFNLLYNSKLGEISASGTPAHKSVTFFFPHVNPFFTQVDQK